MMMTYCNASRRRGPSSSSQFNFLNQKQNEETNNKNIVNSYDNRSFLLESFPDYNTFAECLLHTDTYQLQPNNTNKLFTTTPHSIVTKPGFINSNTGSGSGYGGGSIEEINKQSAITDERTRANTRGAISTINKNNNNNKKNSTTAVRAVISNNDVVLTMENKLPPIINDLCCSSRGSQQNYFSLKTTSVKQQYNTIKDSFTFSTTTTFTSSRSNKKEFFKVYNDNVSGVITAKNSANKSQQASIFDGSTQNKTLMAPVTTATALLNEEERKIDEAEDIEVVKPVHGSKEVIFEIGRVCEEDANDVMNEDDDDDGQDTFKALPSKPLRRTGRSMTNDERMMTYNQEHLAKKKSPMFRCNSIDSTQSLRGLIVDENQHFIEKSIGDRKTSVPSKKRRSKKKILQRSMSLGFSKFKSLAIFKPHHQRFNDKDIQLDFNDADHQTSRRKNTVTGSGDLPSPKSKIDENDDEDKSSIDESFEKFDKLTGNQLNNYPPLMRSLSAPDPIDDKFEQAEDDYDEDLSELYLPRRRAICPNLPVPAMKQLKTYLILTRLKQYCFV